ncbi:MAG: type IV pili methyl-accepting chemotaxis transducer N-terminal domain-containing protein [Epsilonproteobacteria bacterium]|nr:type IV pili methyl-accepting chemotaxis transducer N-terminal domain-containing protein [Campylobacterota bacterium]
MNKVPSTSKLVTKVKIIGGLLSLVIIVIIVLGIIMSKRSERDSFVINLAGKERMLSQRITKDIYFIKSKDSFDFVDLDNSINEFDFNLQSLQNGDENLNIDPPPTKEIMMKLEEVSVIWKPFPIIVEALKTNVQQIKKDKDLYMQHLNRLLMFSDEIVSQMVKDKLPHHYVNLSGRQRMLSQRMTLYFNRYLKTTNENDHYQFEEAQKLYDNTIEAFINDENIIEKNTLFALIQRNYQFWQSYKAFINKMMDKEKEINEYITYIQENNVNLLNTMDEAVWLYTENSESKINLLKNFQYSAGIIALLIMLYSYLLTKELESHINLFVEKVKRLASIEIHDQKDMHIDFACEAELKEASSHINQFTQKVNEAMQHSEDAVQKAEMAIKELQAISDEVDDVINNSKIDESEKKNLNKNLDNTEDIAIESTENLLHVSKLLKKLQANLGNISQTYTDVENNNKKQNG